MKPIKDYWPFFLFHRRCVRCGLPKRRGEKWCDRCFKLSGW